MTEPELKLPRRAEELLRELPVAEPDFDAQAKAIEARLVAAKAEGAPDDLFKAPDLAPESGEPGREPPAASRAVPKGGLAEMARKSVQKTDDDAAALAKELLAATAQRARPSAEMVERVKAASRVPAPSAAAPSANANATSTPLPSEPERPSGVVTRAEAPAAVAPAAATSGTKRGMLIGFVGGALAVAAAALLFVKTQSNEASPTSAALAAERAADQAPAHASPQAPAAGAKPSEPVLSPEALQAAPDPARAEAPKAGGAMPAPAAAPPPSKGSPASAPAAAAPGAKAPEAVVLEDDPEPPKAQAPKAEPAPEPQLKPAEGSTASVPLSPSAGAVSTALSGVRSGAQACLAGQTESVTAVITFAADGHVQSVSAGGPSGACIQAALSKAHIAPFAKPTFSATTTVRPP